MYLVLKSDGTAKVGISGQHRLTERLRIHGSSGYRQIAVWEFGLGRDARAVEKEMVRRWREEDDLLPAAPEGEEGWTETVHTDSLPLEEIIKRINKLAREQPSYASQR